MCECECVSPWPRVKICVKWFCDMKSAGVCFDACQCRKTAFFVCLVNCTLLSSPLVRGGGG